MDFKSIKQNKNALFDRDDITFKATDTGSTPSRGELKDLIAATTSHKAETIAIINITSEFGKDSIRGLAHVYKSKDELERKEPKYVTKRNTPKPKKKEEPKAEAAPAEEKKEEPAPAEEAKPEEAPAEENGGNQ